MNLQEIKKAVDEGKVVCWSSKGYTVHKIDGEYYIIWQKGCPKENTIGLTWMDGVTLNGKEEKFFVVPQKIEGIEAIKRAVDEGKLVRWSNEGYTVHKVDSEYLITWAKGTSRESSQSLTWSDGITITGDGGDFYIDD